MFMKSMTVFKGSYCDIDRRVILCAFTSIEETKLKVIIRELDPQAFIITSDIASVHGGRFKEKDIH